MRLRVFVSICHNIVLLPCLSVLLWTVPLSLSVLGIEPHTECLEKANLRRACLAQSMERVWVLISGLCVEITKKKQTKKWKTFKN